jgi:hypothetical protein
MRAVGRNGIEGIWGYSVFCVHLYQVIDGGSMPYS